MHAMKVLARWKQLIEAHNTRVWYRGLAPVPAWSFGDLITLGHMWRWH